MVEGNAAVGDWPTEGLARLVTVVEEARNAGKYLFIWDKQGSVATFMQYKG